MTKGGRLRASCSCLALFSEGKQPLGMKMQARGATGVKVPRKQGGRGAKMREQIRDQGLRRETVRRDQGLNDAGSTQTFRV